MVTPTLVKVTSERKKERKKASRVGAVNILCLPDMINVVGLWR
jgi:hypothetical protein